MAQLVEDLPSKRKVLSSNLVLPKILKKQKKKPEKLLVFFLPTFSNICWVVFFVSNEKNLTGYLNFILSRCQKSIDK
jgi:hypothetical protein